MKRCKSLLSTILLFVLSFALILPLTVLPRSTAYALNVTAGDPCKAVFAADEGDGIWINEDDNNNDQKMTCKVGEEGDGTTGTEQISLCDIITGTGTRIEDAQPFNGLPKRCIEPS